MIFEKYHALGNDYLVLHPDECPELFDKEKIRLVCHRNFGLGSDGILYGPLETDVADFKLRILNPDGSEAEKSGNGLRIFCYYLWDQGQVEENKPFTIDTLGGIVTCEVGTDAKVISVEMGKVTFISNEIPVNGASREVINETLDLGDKQFTYCAASVGNPHCVIPLDEISEKLAKEIGPLVENHKNFPNRINMQLLKVIDRNTIQIEIWERGAGYTLASGSSSSAAASVAYKLGLCDKDITVRMPGGEIGIKIADDFSVNMKGPATRVGTMVLDENFLNV
jgi:diaminopimelate epimerase